MKTTKLLALNKGGTPFQEGAQVNPIQFQPKFACKKVLFAITGTIVITSKTGTITPQFAAAADGTSIIPYLLPLAGTLTFNGTCNSGKGLKVNNVPIWLLWLESFIENRGNGPIVNDGGMLAAGFVAGTYSIAINFMFNFYDPMLPPSQRGMMYYRPVRYNNQPTWSIAGGTFFSGANGNYTANQDTVALTGDSTTNAALVYTALSQTLTVYATAVQVPSFKQSVNDICFDRNYEYTFSPDCSASATNKINLADLGVQQYILMLTTNLAASGGGASTNLIEAGVDSLFGASNQGQIETDAGDTPMSLPFAVNTKADDQDNYMTGQSQWPEGVLLLDEYGHNLNEWAEKTWLQATAPNHVLNQYINPATNGSNNRVLHMTAQPSQPAIASQKNNFPPFQGAA